MSLEEPCNYGRIAAVLLHNMSAPPRTTIQIEVQPVFGAVLVCLSQCLRLNGLIDPEMEIRETEFRRLGEACAEWAGGGSPDQFWQALKARGFSRSGADACAREFGGACIGWAEQIYPQTGCSVVHYPPHNRICNDLHLCLAILSRRVDNMFLSYRPSDYSLEQLLGWAFVADDPRLAARSIAWEQWPLKNQEKPRDCPFRPVSHQGVRHGLNARTL